MPQFFAKFVSVYFRDLTRPQVAQFKRAIADADQAVHFHFQIFKGTADLTLFPLGKGDDDPAIGPCLALKRCGDFAKLLAIDHNAVFERVEFFLCNTAMGAGAVGAGKRIARQFQRAGKAAIIGQ